MDDLIAFLRARLDEDERIATNDCHLHGDSWTAHEISPNRVTWEVLGGAAPIQALDWEARHIARHDPARVLADVAAKRAILDRAEHTWKSFHDPANALEGHVSRREKSHAVETFHDLAGPYSDHPDFSEAWRP